MQVHGYRCCSVTNILQNIIFCVRCKKGSHTALKWCKWWQNCPFMVNYTFKWISIQLPARCHRWLHTTVFLTHHAQLYPPPLQTSHTSPIHFPSTIITDEMNRSNIKRTFQHTSIYPQHEPHNTRCSSSIILFIQKWENEEGTNNNNKQKSKKQSP